MSFSRFDFKATSKVTAPAKLAHVVLFTNQIDVMEKFYVDFLGATVVHKEPKQISFIAYDDEHHRIALLNRPDLKDKDPQACGLHHIGFTLSTFRDLLLAYRQRLQQYNIKPYWCVHHGLTISMYYRDPDGNSLEMQVDCFDTNEEATAFMMSEKFKQNPIGTDYDPEEMIKKLQEDADWEGWRERREIGQRGPESVPVPA